MSIGALFTRGEYKINSPRRRFPTHLITHEPDDNRYIELGWKKMKKPENQAINGRLVFFEQVMVGKTGFEPATPWSQTRCATGLRYFPYAVNG